MSKGAAAITLSLLVLGLAGCRSSTLPPHLTQEQLEAVETTRFKASVGVERDKFPVHAVRLTAALRRTELFERVDALDSFETPPTFVARLTRPLYPIYGKDDIRIWLWVFSLGLIPAYIEGEQGHAFTLTPASTGSQLGKAQRIAVRFSYRSQIILGWWAFFQHGDQDQTLEEAGEHTRFTQGLAWHIARQAKEISRHVDGGT